MLRRYLLTLCIYYIYSNLRSVYSYGGFACWYIHKVLQWQGPWSNPSNLCKTLMEKKKINTLSILRGGGGGGGGGGGISGYIILKVIS